MQPGEVIDRYEIEALLGEGGMASVWRVRHRILGSRHALKILSPHLVAEPELRERFLSEGRIQSQLRHHHIVSVTDVVAEPSVAGLVMEFVEGPTLEVALTERGGPWSRAEILEILLPVLDGVGLAHAQGVIHRDLKPSNILLGREADGRLRPVIVDFGIAHVGEGAALAGGKGRSTRTGIRLGTLSYMSPEQVRASREIDGRSDIFSLGAILWELATGSVAFCGDSEFDTMRRIVDGDLEFPERELHAADPGLEAILRIALSTDPAGRFPDCAAFAGALRGEGASTATPERTGPTRPAPRGAASQKPRIAEVAPGPAAQPQPSAWSAPLDTPAALKRDHERVAIAVESAGWALTFSLLSWVLCCGIGHVFTLAKARRAARVLRQEGVRGGGARLAWWATAVSLLGIGLMVLTFAIAAWATFGGG